MPAGCASGPLRLQCQCRNAQRLTAPLIRKSGMPKSVTLDPANPLAMVSRSKLGRGADFAPLVSPASADTAPHVLAGFWLRQLAATRSLLFQKLVRTGFAVTHNVDHCTRPALLLPRSRRCSKASARVVSNWCAMSSSLTDHRHRRHPAANHPVAASFIKNATERGARLVMIDPRRTPPASPRLAHAAVPPMRMALLLSMVCV